MASQACKHSRVATREIFLLMQAEQVCNFLNHLAFKIDPTSLKPSSESTLPYNLPEGIEYKPMRRRLAIHGQ